jgi:hypothetical protein
VVGLVLCCVVLRFVGPGVTVRELGLRVFGICFVWGPRVGVPGLLSSREFGTWAI